MLYGEANIVVSVASEAPLGVQCCATKPRKPALKALHHYRRSVAHVDCGTPAEQPEGDEISGDQGVSAADHRPDRLPVDDARTDQPYLQVIAAPYEWRCLVVTSNVSLGQ